MGLRACAGFRSWCPKVAGQELGLGWALVRTQGQRLWDWVCPEATRPGGVGLAAANTGRGACGEGKLGSGQCWQEQTS